MPQEPLKLFKWYHISASEGTQAVQQCLGTIVREACRHTHPSLTPTGRDFRCVRSKMSVGRTRQRGSYCHPQISQSARRWSSARARETSADGGRGCQSFEERKGEIAAKSCSYAHNRRMSHPRTHCHEFIKLLFQLWGMIY